MCPDYPIKIIAIWHWYQKLLVIRVLVVLNYCFHRIQEHFWLLSLFCFKIFIWVNVYSFLAYQRYHGFITSQFWQEGLLNFFMLYPLYVLLFNCWKFWNIFSGCFFITNLLFNLFISLMHSFFCYCHHSLTKNFPMRPHFVFGCYAL